MSKPLAHMTDSELRNWAVEAMAKIAPAPLTWGITADAAAEFGDLVSSYDSAFQAATDPQRRGVSTIFAKTEARKALVAFTQKMVRQIQASPLVTDQMRTDLGITVGKEPAPIPTPSTSPVLWAEQVVSRTVLLRTNGPKGGRVKRPAGVRGIALYTAVGSKPPAVGSPDWQFRGNTSENLVEVDFPTTVPNGSAVWICAFYIGSRLESGPISSAISAILPGDLSEAESSMKLAA